VLLLVGALGVLFVGCAAVLASTVDPNMTAGEGATESVEPSNEDGVEADAFPFASTESTLPAAPSGSTTQATATSAVSTTATTEPESASIESQPTSTAQVVIDDEELEGIAFVFLVRSNFPFIDAAIEADPPLDEVLVDLGQWVCDVAEGVETAEELSLGLLLLWAELDASNRLLMNNDSTGLAEFAGYAIGALCSSEFDRLMG
jgi:hypothetical protein